MSIASVSRPMDHTIYTNVNGFEDLKRQAREDQKSALRPVAQQFEALFLQEILKNARKVKFDDGWLEGGQSDIYHDMYDKQLAQDMATKGSVGLADIIVEQLTPSLPSLQGEALEAWLAEQEQRQQAFNRPTTQDALALRALKAGSD